MRSILTAIALLACAASGAQNLRSGGRLKPEQAIMDIRHYALHLKVDPDSQSISGYTDIDLILQEPGKDLLFDFWNGLQVSEVLVNNKKAGYSHENDMIHIPNEAGWPSGRVKVRVRYGGKPAVAIRPPWTGGFTWAKDGQGNPWIAITCQGEGAKIYFPCKDHPSDEPNEGADLFITVPKGLVVAGPGLLEKVTTQKNWSTYHWATHYTISNYCIVFNIGKFKVVTRNYTTIKGNTVPMQFYVLEEHADKAAYHLELLEKFCHIDEKYFGEYPWVKEKIGICETPHLGMEHQTMNAYGNKFNYSKLGGQDFDWLMYHEFGHEWWANKVTNKDWAHMWIQEGICSFGDALAVRELEGEKAYQRRMQQIAWNLKTNIPVVRGEVMDSDSAYEGPIYGKGAFFMHTLRYMMGDSLFFPTLLRLATDSNYTYDHMIGTSDVEHLFSGAAGQDLKPIFHLFLYTPDRLEVLVKQSDSSTYNISLLNLDMNIPMQVRTAEGERRMVLGKKPVKISSHSLPEIDPDVFYFRKVIYE